MGKGCGGSGSKPKGNKEPSAAATPANAPGQLVVKRDIDFLDNELDEAPPPLAPRTSSVTGGAVSSDNKKKKKKGDGAGDGKMTTPPSKAELKAAAKEEKERKKAEVQRKKSEAKDSKRAVSVNKKKKKKGSDAEEESGAAAEVNLNDLMMGSDGKPPIFPKMPRKKKDEEEKKEGEEEEEKTEEEKEEERRKKEEEEAEKKRKEEEREITECHALYDFEAINADEDLTVAKGEELWCIDKDGDPNWWEMRNAAGETGLVPSNFIEEKDSQLGRHGLLDPKTNSFQAWFHGRVTRDIAQHMLSSHATLDGYFLVRESTKFKGEYTLSMCCDSEMYHYRIQRDPANEFTMGDTELDLSFPRIDLLVEHYQEDAGGLPTTLTMPCPNSTRQFFNYKMTFLKKKLEIDRPELKFAKVIGSGQFGEVWVGMIKDQRVAIKTNKEDNMLAVTEFFYEGEIMVNFNHDHIVKLLGVSTETAPMCIVLEFLDKGSLLDHLRSRGRAVISPADLLRYSAEMGSAMAYLEQNRYLHRDLAARNVLVGSDDHCKLADFGLSVQLDPGHDHYIAPEGSKFPIKWTAPESLKTNYFTIKSDVWSFGILLWEMYSYGRSPYSKINHKDIAKELEEGTRMEAPSGCPDYIFQMMRDTWLEEPDDRPSFADICVRIEQAPEDCRATTSPEEPPPTD